MSGPVRLSLADVHEAIAATRPDDECLVFRDRRFTWAEVTDRTRRFANHLVDHGLGCRVERSALEGHESGQDHLAIYLHNGNEYLECMLGALKARVAPFNVNYRYVAEELLYLLQRLVRRPQSSCTRQFAPTLAELLPELPDLRVILQVPDDSGNDLLPGATWYEDALASAVTVPSAGRVERRRPLHPLHRRHDRDAEGRHVAQRRRDGRVLRRVEDGVDDRRLPRRGRHAVCGRCSRPPFMHGAGHWMSFRTWLGGGTVFIQSVPERLEPSDIWGLVEQEQLNFLLIVGDAFARPLLDELDRRPYELSSLTVLLSGGAPLSAKLKDEFLRHLPTLMIVDGLGSSEAGGQMSHVSTGGGATTGTFAITPGNHVLSADLDRELEPGDPELGWLAKSGRLALGYLNDRAKTQRSYPVVDGTRYAVPGDRARLRADGVVELHGRDSVTINSGGEKIFAEEVEAAIKSHEAVYDCVVAGRASERWGQEVVAIVRVRDGYGVESHGR